MADRSIDPDPNTTGDAGMGPGRGSRPGTPLWVKVFGLIAIIVVLLVAVIVMSGLGGPHGPQRHALSGHHQADLTGQIAAG